VDERGQGFEKAADLVKKRVERAVLQQFSHGSARPKVLQHVASVCICAILWLWQHGNVFGLIIPSSCQALPMFAQGFLNAPGPLLEKTMAVRALHLQRI
jgi:hypothetical protein